MKKKVKEQKAVFLIATGGGLLIASFVVSVLTMMSVYNMSDEDFAGTEKSLSALDTASHIGMWLSYAGTAVLLAGIVLLIVKSVRTRR